jgi:hypothetical protein
MKDLKKIIFYSIIILSPVQSFAQKPTSINFIFVDTVLLSANKQNKVCIKDLTVSGTKKTKVGIVYREIPFKTGDSLVIANLYKELEQARFQVYNTTLFNEIKFQVVALDSGNINIHVQVVERWYLYPVPQFKWIDRNFNEWFKTYNASLSRVNYGIKFVHYNFSGKRDQLRVYLINGYTKNLSFSYTSPLNKALNEGFTIGGGYLQKRELPIIANYNDSLIFYPSYPETKAKADFVYKSWYANAGFTIRRGFFTKHIFATNFTYIKIADSVVLDKQYNPNYFKDPVTSKGIFDLSYTLQYSNLDNGSYPLKGKNYAFFIQKRGLGFTGGINMLQLEASYNKYIDLGKKWYSSVQLNGKIKLPFDQAYINQRGLGYGENYLRGLEYYVVDGVAAALVKSTIKKKLFAIQIPFRYFPKLFTKIPITVFAKSFTDFGYVYTKKQYDTYLSNRLLYTGGFGIDILTLYDINLRFEYSFNQLGKNGLFLHNQSGF